MKRGRSSSLDCDCGRKPGKHTALDCGVPIPQGRTDGPATRYCIVGDNSGHEYYIPIEHSDEWYRWLEINEDDERAWDVPDYAVRIEGYFTFTDPKLKGD